jgi:hypothetical protein
MATVTAKDATGGRIDVKRLIVLRPDQKPRERCVRMKTKPAFPALGAPMSQAWVLGSSCRGSGIAKILKKRQLHPRQACHPVDVGSKSSVAGKKGS